MILFDDIKAAKRRIDPYILHTPLLRVPELDDFTGCKTFIKPENFQITGSFKLRGAMNFLLQLNKEQLTKGVVCASSGNHAKGVAYAARKLGINAMFIMPTNCNPTKLAGVKALGGTVLLEGILSSQRMAKAIEMQERGYVLVHSHADPIVIAGQGTIGMEILEDKNDIDVIVVPVGGGGLISGVATAVKANNSDIRVMGVEPSGAARYTASRVAGKPVAINNVQTIADGTRCDKANPDNFEIIESMVDDLVNVDDESIKKAMKLLIEIGKIVAEPSSSLGIAASIAGKLPVSPNDKVCFIITGGNNNFSQLAALL